MECETAAESAAAVAEAAVASGAWPLYRYDPQLADSNDATVDADGAANLAPAGFAIDSQSLRADLATFLDRSSHLSLRVRAKPHIGSDVGGVDISATSAALASQLRASYDALVRGVALPPLAVYYGSDGGNAEGVARRAAAEARDIGFPSVTVSSADALVASAGVGGLVAALAATSAAIFVISTAGQGDFPANARAFWSALTAAIATHQVAVRDAAATGAPSPASLLPSSMLFAVFGLGDSNYWPRVEHAAYYNKPVGVLDAALAAAGATRLVYAGRGDDAAVGGYAAAFRAWIPGVWTALGVAAAPVTASSGGARIRANEAIKVTSNFLRGTIAQGLEDTSTGALTYEDTQLTKFHGIYQQDDR